MKQAGAWVAMAALSVGLTGCTRLFQTVRAVPKALPPDAYKTADEEQLQKGISDRDNAIHNLFVTATITAATGGAKEGEVKEYTSLRGYIFIQKPGDLRVILQKPYIGGVAMDMVSDGSQFKMLINPLTGPPRGIVGSNQVTKPSKNGLENLRPSVFLDSLLVAGVQPEEYISKTDSTRLLPPTGKHKAGVEEPDYDLALLRIRSGHMLELSRLIHISRLNLLPVEQDIYDADGHIVTIATYDKYQDFNGQQFPTVINIRRPMDEYSLKVELTKATLNGTLEADQFVLNLPDGIAIQHMD